MATKAELMSAIEVLNKHVNTLAAVAAALPDDVPKSDKLIAQVDGDKIIINASGDIKAIKWVRVNDDTGKWYGNITRMPISGTLVLDKMTLGNPKDAVLIMWGGPDDMASAVKVQPVVKAPPAPTTLPTPPVPTVPATPSSDLRFKFVAPMKVGTNQERLNMAGLSYGGTSLRQSPAYATYLGTIGTTWDRYFTPMNFEMDRGCGVGIPGMWACDQLLDCALQSITVGRRVLYSPLDVMGQPEFAKWSDVITWFTAACKRAAERGMDPERFAFELCNEWATDDAQLCNAKRNELYIIARQYLPNHRFVVGGPEWNGWKRFDAQWAPPPDNDYIIGFHHYEALSDFGGIADHMTAFGKNLNVPVICGELNVDFNHMDQSKYAAMWAQNFVNFAKTGKGIPFAAWAFIGGKNDFRLNINGTDPRAIPAMETAFKQSHAFMSL